MTTRMTMRMSLMKFMATQSLGAVDDERRRSIRLMLGLGMRMIIKNVVAAA